VTFIGGILQIGDDDGGNPMLENLEGLNGLSGVGIGIGITNNENLVSLNGLQNLSTVGYLGLGVYNNDMLANFFGLNGISVIAGGLAICGNDGLTSLEGLENLTSIGGNFWLGHEEWGGGGNSSLTSLTGLSSLTSIGDGLSVVDNELLSDLGALSTLQHIGSDLEIGSVDGFGNASLASLAGLGGLDTVGGDLIITNNEVLSSLEELENALFPNMNRLVITENDSLTYCEIQEICSYLADPAGTIEIVNNATGCNNQSEVEVACGVGVDEPPASGPKLEGIIYPNPSSSSRIIIEILTPLDKCTFITIYNINGQEILSCKIIKAKTEVDVSGMTSGFFYVKISGSDGIIVRKFVKQ
jgi:hypothetical protein